jgi:hypothetical protein
VREATLTIRGRATDDTAVAVVTVQGQAATLEIQGTTATFAATLSLRPGVHELVIRACDVAQNCSTQPLLVRYVPRSQLYAQLWAVVIGIDRYQHDEVPQLAYAVKDAQAIGAMLKQQGFIVRELYNEEATTHAIRTL